ncbi:hypothetical protein BT93_H1562 [Corymbia citriodora subsp. variegata]|nr:hypothetical protein BT93_H1562 [Corymbia citriodora subsp. variegata]
MQWRFQASLAQSNRIKTEPTTMSLSFRFVPTCSPPPPSHLRFPLLSRSNLTPTSIRSPSPSKFILSSPIRCVNEGSDPASVTRARPRWENALSAAASLYPLYVTVGGVVACLKPSAFQWFVQRGPTSYSLSLGLIMLAMGLTLQLKDLLSLFLQRPLSILFGFGAQYTIMPALGTIISKLLGLRPSLSVGLILLACCPGGTASNVVTLISQGDVPLSIVMTVCTTLGAVLLTPLLTRILAGTYVPVDAIKISISTLQVVVAPILLGSYFKCISWSSEGCDSFAPLFCSIDIFSIGMQCILRKCGPTQVFIARCFISL